MSSPVSPVSAVGAAAVAAYSDTPDPAPVAPASPGFVLSTADLSQTAQALSLQEQGDTPSEIAEALGTSVAIVDGYLGITPAPVAAPVATPVQAAPSTPSPAQSSDSPAKT